MTTSLKEAISFAFKPPFRYWFILVILINLFLDQRGGTNAASRMVTLFSLAESKSFEISHYIERTVDWAKLPSGEIYSNKAPGPTLLAAPLYLLTDGLISGSGNSRFERDEARFQAAFQIKKILSLLFQLVPFLFIVGLWLREFQGKASLFVCVALLFGTTAALFLNTYFGHGFAAWVTLALFFSLWKRAWAISGFLYGLWLLSDYLAIAALVPLIIFVARDSDKKGWALFLLGGLTPAIVWSLYHGLLFGSPFALPNKFQNPIFVDMTEGTNLWGILTLPSGSIIFELLLGIVRGVLVTQPWVLCILVLSAFFTKTLPLREKRFVRFILISFVIALLINAGFGGWHGGKSPGPRYLSSFLVGFALIAGWLWDNIPRQTHRLLWEMMAVSLLFYSLVFAIELTPPVQPIWGYYLGEVKAGAPNGLRLLILIPFGFGLWRAAFSLRNPEDDRPNPQ